MKKTKTVTTLLTCHQSQATAKLYARINNHHLYHYCKVLCMKDQRKESIQHCMKDYMCNISAKVAQSDCFKTKLAFSWHLTRVYEVV